MKPEISSVFEFQETPVRIAVREGAPWFVAADVCRVLEIANHRDAVTSLDDDEKDGVGITDAIGREQTTTCVSESGLYALIFKSRKETARSFRKWVTSEVLPAIRRDGAYSLRAESGLDRVQWVLEETVVAVHEGRCALNKASVVANLACQYLRSAGVRLVLNGKAQIA